MSDPLDRLVMITQHVHNQQINKSEIPRGPFDQETLSASSNSSSTTSLSSLIETNFSRPVPGCEIKISNGIKPN